MSIWCSGDIIGTWTAFSDGEAKRGQVLTYAQGWSNHYPTTDGAVEEPTNLDVAHVAPWCVPGWYRKYADDEVAFDDDECGEWLRLTVDGKSVVMDEAATRALAADLLEWAERPKVQPTAIAVDPSGSAPGKPE